MFANICLSCSLNKTRPPSIGRLYRGMSLIVPLFIHWWDISGLVPPLLLEAPKRAVKLCVVVFFCISYPYPNLLVPPTTSGERNTWGGLENPKWLKACQLLPVAVLVQRHVLQLLLVTPGFDFSKIGKFCCRTIRACQNQVCSFGSNSFGYSFIG